MWLSQNLPKKGVLPEKYHGWKKYKHLAGYPRSTGFYQKFCKIQWSDDDVPLYCPWGTYQTGSSQWWVSVEYKRNPISFIKTRSKKPESIYKKLKKLGYDFTAENIQNQLNDVAGIRVVCAFIDDIYTIADLIAKQDDITVIQVKDYIKNPKPNGYRSYHMIVEIPVFFSKGKTPMRAEIQIRTNGMDFWATLEHQLRYKQDIEEMDGYEEVSSELLNCARAVIDMDNEMQRIKDKIGRFHDI